MANLSSLRHLIKYAFDLGCSITIPDPDSDEMIRIKPSEGKTFVDAYKEIEGYDGGTPFYIVPPKGYLFARDPDLGDKGKSAGIAVIWVMPAIGYGNYPDEEVADYTCSSAFSNDWEEKFKEAQAAMEDDRETDWHRYINSQYSTVEHAKDLLLKK